MATHAPIARVPFASLDNSRLQRLASAKNRQNGMLSQQAGKATVTGKASMPTTFSPSKRSFDIAVFDDANADSENVDPDSWSSPSKKAKADVLDKPAKSLAFSFSSSPIKPSSMGPPPSIPARLSTPIRANMSSSRAPLSAPAGLKRKASVGTAQKPRRVSALFSRIDPPSGHARPSGLPFSLDAALNASLSSGASARSTAGATIQESTPKAWQFDIYEDTPEEEATNLMEHSTLTLDLSSDDDEAGKPRRDDRGKENTPPEGYDAPTASRPAASSAAIPSLPAAGRSATKHSVVRLEKLDADCMDDGRRSPLGELEVKAEVDDGAAVEAKPVLVAPVTKGAKVVKGDITVWEDKAAKDTSD